MEKLIEIVSNIKEPLGIAGLGLLVLLLILKEIVKDTKDKEVKLSVINKLFVISILAMLLGVAGFAIEKFQPIPPQLLKISGNVYDLNKRAIEGVTVSADNIDDVKTTNPSGKFEMSFYNDGKIKVLHLSFLNKALLIDTAVFIPIDSFPRNFTLFRKGRPGEPDQHTFYIERVSGLESSIGKLGSKLAAKGYVEKAGSPKKITIAFDPVEPCAAADGGYTCCGDIIISLGSKSYKHEINLGGSMDMNTAKRARFAEADRIINASLNEIFSTIKSAL